MSFPDLGVPPYRDWLPAAVLVPLALAAAMCARGLRSAALAMAPWAALPGLMLAATPDFRVEWPWLLLGTQLGLDATGRVFLTFTALLWLIAGLYGRSYWDGDPNRHRITAFFLAALGGNLGVILALDVASFYFFFALMTFAAYGLIVHEGSEAACRAGRIYLILAIFGEILLFIAFMSGVGTAKNLLLDVWPAAVAASGARELIVALVLLGFGVKVGVLVLHVWLPLAHPAAPTPASAILSGVILKAGLLGWLRFLPLGHVALPEWGCGCAAAGIAAAFYGVALGVTQNEAKTVLAYSSISQMGLITFAVGIWLALPAAGSSAWAAIMLYAAHHALAKGALFLGVGVARAAGRETRLKRRAVAGLILPSLALIGAPFTSGALAKQALKDTAGSVPALPGWLPWMLSFAAVGTTLLLARFLLLVWREAPGESHGARMPGLAFAWGLSLAGVLGLAWVLFPKAAGALIGQGLEPSRLWSEIWPPAMGATLAFLFGARFRRLVPAIPAGDLLAPLERWVFRLRQAWPVPDCAGAVRHRDRWLGPLYRRIGGIPEAVARGQSALDGLTTAGIFLLLLILVFVLALLPPGG